MRPHTTLTHTQARTGTHTRTCTQMLTHARHPVVHKTSTRSQYTTHTTHTTHYACMVCSQQCLSPCLTYSSPTCHPYSYFYMERSRCNQELKVSIWNPRLAVCVYMCIYGSKYHPHHVSYLHATVVNEGLHSAVT